MSSFAESCAPFNAEHAAAPLLLCILRDLVVDTLTGNAISHKPLVPIRRLSDPRKAIFVRCRQVVPDHIISIATDLTQRAVRRA